MSEEFNLDAALDQLLELDDDGLLDAPEKPKPVTSTDRLERAFMEILEFRREHGRIPDSNTRVITERKLGARLDGFHASAERAEKVRHLDTEFGLLNVEEDLSLDDILDGDDDLDLLESEADIFDLSGLPKVRKSDSEFEVARRKKCKDFSVFEPFFKAKHTELQSGAAKLIKYHGASRIKEGSYFVLNGMMLFVADIGEKTIVSQAARDRVRYRLRVIFENGTESSMYKSSLSSVLGTDNGQEVVAHDFEKQAYKLDEEDAESGHIYVLRSLSADPQISSIPNLHKIGFSTTPVAKRIIGAETSPTYLMAPVEVVADYRVYNVKPSKLEALLHRLFAEVRLGLTQVGGDGKKYDPAEWFMVPFDVIDQAIDMILTGDIVDFVYDKNEQDLVWVGEKE